MIDGSKGVKARINSFDITLFFFWFNLINFCLSRVGICKDQGITNIEEVDKPNTDIVAKDPNIGTIDIKKLDRASKLGTGIADAKEADKVDNLSTSISTKAIDLNTGITNAKGVDRADKQSASIVDAEEADGADNLGISTIDVEEVDGVDNLGTGIAAENL